MYTVIYPPAMEKPDRRVALTSSYKNQIILSIKKQLL